MERIIVRYLSLQEQVLEDKIVVPCLFHSTNGVCGRLAAHTLYFNQLGCGINKICWRLTTFYCTQSRQVGGKTIKKGIITFHGFTKPIHCNVFYWKVSVPIILKASRTLHFFLHIVFGFDIWHWKRVRGLKEEHWYPIQDCNQPEGGHQVVTRWLHRIITDQL